MGNAGTSAIKRDRNYSYSIDYVSGHRDSGSPKSDEFKTFDFGSIRKKPLLCYQSSVEYGNDDNYYDFKVCIIAAYE
jgi:hypothetical protein